MRKVKVAATQMGCTWDREETLKESAGISGFRRLQDVWHLWGCDYSGV